jgi:hypothetical protein
MRLAGISPCDAGAFDNVDHSFNSEDAEDDDSSPTPIYNAVRTTRPETRDQIGYL